MVRPAPSHLELVALAREVQLAAAAADRGRLRHLVRQLATSIAAHVDEDAARHDALPPPVRHLVARGQQRLLDHARALEEHAGRDDCRCLLPAAELTVLLGRQAVLERAVLHDADRPGAGASPATVESGTDCDGARDDLPHRRP